MDSVQICFICLDAIYHGHILLYSSYKKKKKTTMWYAVIFHWEK